MGQIANLSHNPWLLWSGYEEQTNVRENIVLDCVVLLQSARIPLRQRTQILPSDLLHMNYRRTSTTVESYHLTGPLPIALFIHPGAEVLQILEFGQRPGHADGDDVLVVVELGRVEAGRDIFK